MTLSRLFTTIAIFTALCAGVVSATVIESPVSSVSLGATLSDAHKVADRHGNMQVLRISGNSMLPFFGDGSVVIVKPIEETRLQAGMVVVYRNRFGETVAHRLIARSADGWTAQGYNNTSADSTPVNADNLMGVVYATFHSNGDLGTNPIAANLSANTAVALAAPAK